MYVNGTAIYHHCYMGPNKTFKATNSRRRVMEIHDVNAHNNELVLDSIISKIIDMGDDLNSRVLVQREQPTGITLQSAIMIVGASAFVLWQLAKT